MQVISVCSANVGRLMSIMFSTVLVISTCVYGQTPTEQEASIKLQTSAIQAQGKLDAAHYLKQKLTNLITFEANFEQKVTDVNHEVLQQAHGKIALKQPNKMYWQLDEPNESILIADGQTLWHIDPFVEQVVALEQNKSIENNPLILLTNVKSDAWENFDITQQGSTFTINATQTDASVVKLILRFEQETLLELSMQDSQQQLSQLIFSEIKQNQTIDDSRFLFEHPEGYELDDQRNQ